MKTKKRGGSVKTAAAVVTAAVDRRMAGWRSLNIQVRWAIDDVLVKECGVPESLLSAVKTEMSWAAHAESGGDDFWVRFFCWPSVAQFEAAAKALAAIGGAR